MLVDKITKYLDAGVISVFLSMKKAVDTVDNHILFKKYMLTAFEEKC